MSRERERERVEGIRREIRGERDMRGERDGERSMEREREDGGMDERHST